jgi:hypothetical protein
MHDVSGKNLGWILPLGKVGSGGNPENYSGARGEKCAIFKTQHREDARQ